MQAYYRCVLGQDGPVSPDERQALRRAMIDYGALQPSPVQKPVDMKAPPDADIVRNSISQEVRAVLIPFPDASLSFQSRLPRLCSKISSSLRQRQRQTDPILPSAGALSILFHHLKKTKRLM